MDLTQIHHFLVLAETLNFTRAAELCNISQPGLTKSIHRLEAELGGELLYRERELTQLTELGRAMLPLLQQSYEAAEHAKQRAHDLRTQDDAPVRLGIGASISVAAIAPLVTAVGEQFPQAPFLLSGGTVPELSDQALHGELDVLLVPEEEGLHDRLNRWELYRQRLAVLLRADDPLAAAATVPAAALAGRNLITLRGRGGPLARAADWLRETARIELVSMHQADRDAHIQALVLGGIGLALLTDRHLPLAGLALRPIVEPELSFPVFLAIVSGRRFTRPADAFVKLARTRDWGPETGHAAVSSIP
ncbi:MAG TPA: LysR family transcriptional regulator [Acetobacteraceae bacterium]|nr:LysR family transcriptional regulator [Acetobacteraceae bacterium]